MRSRTDSFILWRDDVNVISNNYSKKTVMGIIRNGLRLLSVLRRPEDERKNIVRIYAKARSWDDVAKLGKGEVVRKGHL